MGQLNDLEKMYSPKIPVKKLQLIAGLGFITCRNKYYSIIKCTGAVGMENTD